MDAASQLEFLREVGKLKHLDRAGWTIQGRNIPKPESVAAHMYRMALAAMMLTEDYVDESGHNVPFNKSRVVEMALVHDLAECRVGDITPFDGISEEEKHRMESQAMDQLTAFLPTDAALHINTLYQEYEERDTVEAQIVKELDRFDVMLQGFEYEVSEYKNRQRNVRFQEFFDNAKNRIKHPQLNRMMQCLVEQREAWEKQKGNINNHY